ncbi:MAG TPA: YlxR family protein [Polyangia bacterium]
MSERTCIGCRETAAPAHLLRLVRGVDGTPRPDPTATLAGRGAWVHPRPGCITQAARQGGLARAFRAAVVVEPAALLGEVRAAVADTTVRLTARWARSGRTPGPLARRIAALETAARNLGTGTRA